MQPLTLPAPAPSAESTLRSRLSAACAAEQVGDYQRAARLLAPFWRGIGVRPELRLLAPELAAEVLLRVGTLTGYMGSAAQAIDAQAGAKDLITEALISFAALDRPERAIAARIELANCYRRQGEFNEARDLLADAITGLAPGTEEYLFAVLRLGVVEVASGRTAEAVRLLSDNAAQIEACPNEMLCGRYQHDYGAALFELSQGVEVQPLTQALAAFAAAGRHFERAGCVRYCASTENNLALTLGKLGRIREARRHLDNARRLALCVDDRRVLADVDDTDAHLLLEQHQLVEAEVKCRARIEALRATDHHSLLAEHLTTHGVALARLGRTAEAEEAFARALAAAELSGDLNRARRLTELTSAELRPRNVLPFSRAGALTFEWRVDDESLKYVGIRRGDVVRFAAARRWRDGDLVAVLTPAGRFVKYIFSACAGHVRLEGAHPRCLPRIYRGDEIAVLGRAAIQ